MDERHPIVLTRDAVLVDGRNRYRACDVAGVDPVFETLSERYTEAMILDLIVSENVRRRNLNPGQLAMIAADLEPMYAAAAKATEAERKVTPPHRRASTGTRAPGHESSSKRADSGAAATIGASGRSTGRAKFVKQAAPDLAAKVRSGEIDLKPAEKEARERLRSQPRPEPTPKPTAVLLTLRTHTGEEVAYPRPAARATFNETTGPGFRCPTPPHIACAVTVPAVRGGSRDPPSIRPRRAATLHFVPKHPNRSGREGGGRGVGGMSEISNFRSPMG